MKYVLKEVACGCPKTELSIGGVCLSQARPWPLMVGVYLSSRLDLMCALPASYYRAFVMTNNPMVEEKGEGVEATTIGKGAPSPTIKNKK